MERGKCKRCQEEKQKEVSHLSGANKVFCDEAGAKWHGLLCPACASGYRRMWNTRHNMLRRIRRENNLQEKSQ